MISPQNIEDIGEILGQIKYRKAAEDEELIAEMPKEGGDTLKRSSKTVS